MKIKDAPYICATDIRIFQKFLKLQFSTKSIDQYT